jgi:hypothetical protein
MEKLRIARNLLILAQLEETAHLFSRQAIPVVVLKGAALIQLHPSYCAERTMEDIDLLVRPGDLEKARRLLLFHGYTPARDDPAAYQHGTQPASIDLVTGFWYLSRRQNEKLWQENTLVPLAGVPGLYCLRYDDFYVHILAHAAIHHARKHMTCKRDLEVLREVAGDGFDERSIEQKLCAYGLRDAVQYYLHGKVRLTPVMMIYRWLLHREHPEGGHIARFLFLKFSRKFTYLAEILFPSRDFIRDRYGLTSSGQLLFFRVFRPFLLFAKLCTFPLRRLAQ